MTFCLRGVPRSAFSIMIIAGPNLLILLQAWGFQTWVVWFNYALILSNVHTVMMVNEHDGNEFTMDGWSDHNCIRSRLLRGGFLRAVQQALRVVEDGACHAGPPCSSWVWLNRGTSQRTVESVMGDLDQPSVVQSNEKLALVLGQPVFMHG